MSQRSLIHYGIILALAALVYANSLGGAFVSDDKALVLDHPHTKRLNDVPAIFTSGHYAGAGGYRPLTTLSFALHYQLHGANPLGYHVISVLLHGLVSVLVYLIFVRLFRAESAALVAGLLFAVHPIHTEAVAWISGRAELLAALCSLGSWLLHLRATGSNALKPGAFAASLFLFFLALLSKENALVLPVMIAAGDFYLARRNGGTGFAQFVRSRVKLYAAFVGVIAAYFVFRWMLYARPMLREAERVAFVDNPLAGTETGVRVLTALKIIGEYLLLLVWPWHLSADYSFNSVPLVQSVTDPGLLVALTLLLILGTICGGSFWRRGQIWLPIALFFIALAPTANLLLPIGTIKAERLLYLPSVAFCLAIGLLYARVPRWPLMANAVVGIALVLLSLRTWKRNADWRTDLTLWSATARAMPQSFRAHFILGSEHLRSGATQAAVEANRRALEIYPQSEDARINLGVALIQAGRLTEATQLLERATREHPEQAAFRLNLGLAYAARGDILSAAGEFEAATKLNPQSAIGFFNLGLALSHTGETERALENYRRAVELKPDYAEAWNALGALWLKLGRKDEARQALSRALQLRPDYRDARFNLDLLNNPVR